jgi:hypothetical protein
MAWLAITPDNVRARLSADELDSYLSAAQEPPHGMDAMAEILAQVTAMVRGSVASCRDNLAKLGSAGTIPSECMFAACTIARDALIGSLPLSEGVTDVRKEELRKAHEFLRSVASCDIRIESTNGTIPEAVPSSSSYGGSAILTF